MAANAVLRVGAFGLRAGASLLKRAVGRRDAVRSRKTHRERGHRVGVSRRTEAHTRNPRRSRKMRFSASTCSVRGSRLVLARLELRALLRASVPEPEVRRPKPGYWPSVLMRRISS